jgi:hypothetical protein
MTGQAGTPMGALTAISDMLDDCIHLQPRQEVLIVADINGLYGGDSVVDQEAISWMAGRETGGARLAHPPDRPGCEGRL